MLATEEVIRNALVNVRLLSADGHFPQLFSMETKKRVIVLRQGIQISGSVHYASNGQVKTLNGCLLFFYLKHKNIKVCKQLELRFEIPELTTDIFIEFVHNFLTVSLHVKLFKPVTTRMQLSNRERSY